MCSSDLIQNPEYRDMPTLTRTVAGTGEKRTLAEGDPQASIAVERVTGQAMVATAADSFGAFFIAYDPSRETSETLAFTRGLVEGRLFEKPDERGIILGKTLASNLGVKLGDRVVYTLTDRHGEIVTGMERLVGVVKSGAPSLDSALCLLPIGTIRSLVGFDAQEATQVAVFLTDGRNAAAVAGRLDGAIDDAAVLTWDQLQPEIRAFIAMKIGGTIVIEAVIGLLVAAGIFNTIFMSVLERTREFGIMVALGYTARQLFAVVMLESSFLAVMGIAASAAVTWPLYNYLYEHGIDMTAAYSREGVEALEVGGVGMDPIMRIGIYPENAVLIVVSITLATLAAGLYPAWKAGRVNPVEAINLV